MSGIRTVIDCETTGLAKFGPGSARDDGVVSVGVAWRGSDNNIHAVKLEANPGEAFYAGGRADPAFRVNGYTESQVRGFMPAERVAPMLKEVLSRIAETEKQPVRLEAYNMDFDRWFLEKEPWSVKDYEWGPCLMRRSMAVMRYDNSHLSLAKALAFAGLKHEGKAHEADVDAKVELLLAEWLDRQEHAAKDRYNLDDIAKDVRDFVRLHQEPPPMPIVSEEEDPDLIFASFIGRCPLEEWRLWHTADKQSWAEWRATRGALGKERESFVIEQMTNAGIRVAHRQRFVREKETGIGGKMDGVMYWPIGTEVAYPIEVKSVTVKLAKAAEEPREQALMQFEAYMRATGYEAGFFVYTGLSYGEYGQLSFVPYRRNDALWEKAKLAALRIREVRRPDAPEPACICGYCNKR